MNFAANSAFDLARFDRGAPRDNRGGAAHFYVG